QGDRSRLQEENTKVSEKLKKKHDSYLRLQTDKEALYNDSRTKIEEIQQRKEEELKALTLKNQKLQQDLQGAQQSCAELKEQIQSLKQDHDRALHGLQEQKINHLYTPISHNIMMIHHNLLRHGLHSECLLCYLVSNNR
ncbi:hypothetical protein AB205_0030910, partial [Aquarana catesbeiana]